MSSGGQLEDVWVEGGAQTLRWAHCRQVKVSGDQFPYLLPRTDAPTSSSCGGLEG